MRLLVVIVLLLMVLAIVFCVRAIQERRIQKWSSKFKTLPNGETIVYLTKGSNYIEYSSIAPKENYENEFERQADIDIALDDALVWAKKHNRL